MNDAIREATKNFTTAQLADLASWAHIEGRNRDPQVIAERKIQEEFWRKREEEGKVKEEHNAKVYRVLQKLLKPGTKLKMRGCKDGSGIREFIKWDENDNLVCWQIVRRRVFTKGAVSFTEEKTNQVTTHMPDKVSRIFQDNKDIPIKNFVK